MDREVVARAKESLLENGDLFFGIFVCDILFSVSLYLYLLSLFPSFISAFLLFLSSLIPPVSECNFKVIK
jgi:hypothetical protein